FPTAYDHSEIDFTRVKEMNMNAIRFYLNYALFEDNLSPYTYKQSGWDWLDQNISWARKNGIYIILNMHVPQGGYQSNGNGMALWDDIENQSRLVSLWQAIAERYKDEPVIAGYDILNEPICSESMDQWKGLANRIVKSIRTVDVNHMIIVERMNGIKGDWTTYGNQNFFLVDDPDIMYTFHFYSPIEYTHQFTSWTSYKDQDGGKYPDPDIVNVPSDTTWADGTFSNPVLPLGDSDWKYYEGARYRVTNPLIITGKPVIASDSNAGTSYFDDFVVKEYDANGDFLRTIYDTNIDSRDGWDFWSKNGLGELALTADEGHGDKKCLTLSKATADTNASYNKLRFKVEQGHCYSISGWMKGKGVTSNSCRFRLDFEKSPSGSPAMARDRNYLENELKKMFSWGETNNVPLYVGEFGVYKSCFQNDKGGIQWVSDMLDIMNKYNVNYTYHDYHEDGFGIYKNSSGLPDEASANTDLISLFKLYLGNSQ
ncbi:MAG TPA: cellulase family glycosylhydrolase, partial [Clostridia bacterium]